MCETDDCVLLNLVGVICCPPEEVCMGTVRLATLMLFCCRCTAACATRCKQHMRFEVCSRAVFCLRLGGVIGQKDTAQKACNKQQSTLPCFMHSCTQQVYKSVKHSLS